MNEVLPMSSITDKLTKLEIEPVRGDDFEPFSHAQIAEIEKIIGTKLPRDYQHFLAQFGHAMFAEEVSCTSLTNPIWFGTFFSFDQLVKTIDAKIEVLPETLIPIGGDGGGNLFCLGVKGDDLGRVYFHNHSIGWHADAERLSEAGEMVPPDIRYQTVIKIADTFEQFIHNMEKER